VPVGSFLQEQMEQGVLQRTPIIAALQQFMGPLLFYVMIRRVVQKDLPFPMPTEEEFVDSLVRTYLSGLRTQEGNSPC
jgi:hypothetical protein